MQDFIFQLGFLLTIPGLIFLVFFLILGYKKTGRKFNILVLGLMLSVLVSYFISVSSAAASKSASLQKTAIKIQEENNGIQQNERIAALDNLESYSWTIALITSVYCLIIIMLIFVLIVKKYAASEVSALQYKLIFEPLVTSKGTKKIKPVKGTIRNPPHA